MNVAIVRALFGRRMTAHARRGRFVVIRVTCVALDFRGAERQRLAMALRARNTTVRLVVEVGIPLASGSRNCESLLRRV